MDGCAIIDDPDDLLVRGIHCDNTNCTLGKRADLYIPLIEVVSANGGDTVALLNPAPRIQIDDAVLTDGGRSIQVSGTVQDMLHPIASVTIDGEVFPVAQVGDNGGFGPYEGVFTVNATAPLEEGFLSDSLSNLVFLAMDEFDGQQAVALDTQTPPWLVANGEFAPDSTATHDSIATLALPAGDLIIGTDIKQAADGSNGLLLITDTGVRYELIADASGNTLTLSAYDGGIETVVGVHALVIPVDAWFGLEAEITGDSLFVRLEGGVVIFGLQDPIGTVVHGGVISKSNSGHFDNFQAEVYESVVVSRPVSLMEEYRYEIRAENGAGVATRCRIPVEFSYDVGAMLSGATLGAITPGSTREMDIDAGKFRVRLTGMPVSASAPTGSVSATSSEATLEFEESGSAAWESQELVLVRSNGSAQASPVRVLGAFGSPIVVNVHGEGLQCSREVPPVAIELVVEGDTLSPITDSDLLAGAPLSHALVRVTRPGHLGQTLDVDLQVHSKDGSVYDGSYGVPGSTTITLFRQSDDHEDPLFDVYRSSPPGLEETKIHLLVGPLDSALPSGAVFLASRRVGAVLRAQQSGEARDQAADEEVSSNVLMYLTFDDGPRFGSDDVIDVLEEVGLSDKAAFYVVGKHIEDRLMLTKSEWRGKRGWSFTEIVELMRSNGSLVGNHSYTHADNKYADFYGQGGQNVLDDFEQNATKLAGIFGQGAEGVTLKAGRLPGRDTWRVGTFSETDSVRNSDSSAAADLMRDNGYTLYGWDLEFATNEFADAPRAKEIELIKAIVNGQRGTTLEGRVVYLFHDRYHRNTRGNREPLRKFLQEMKEIEGLEFERIDELEVPGE